MKILVSGANGKTAEAVTLLAYQVGYEVTAFVYALEPIDFQCTYVVSSAEMHATSLCLANQ